MDRIDDATPYIAAAQALLYRVEIEGKIELTSLSLLQLCALGAASQVAFDPAAAQVWLSRSQVERDDMTRSMLSGLAGTGLLHQYSDDRPESDPQHYRFSPPLGLIMAARARPSFIVVCDVEKHRLMREPVLFALGDQTNPVQAVVVEWPEPPPAGHEKSLSRLGPFGRLNRYMLTTVDYAAALLAEWAMIPTPKPKIGKQPARAVSLFRHDAGHDAIGLRIAVRGDGAHARLVSHSGAGMDVPAECDRQELTNVMSLLLSLRQP